MEQSMLKGVALQRGKGGGEVDLEGKAYTMLFFASGADAACVEFLPTLQSFHNKFARPKGFEVVFVSTDPTEESFEEFARDMPWGVVPFKDELSRTALAHTFNSGKVPELVLIDASGSILCSGGCERMLSDPEGDDFPWTKLDYLTALGTTFLRQKERVGMPEGTRHIGLYFSASWCPPCQTFTPQLVDFYNTYNAQFKSGKGLEIVFFSRDRNVEDFEEYYATMPWLAVPLDDSQRLENLRSMCQIREIPTLVIIDPVKNVLISPQAKNAVLQQGAKKILENGWGGPDRRNSVTQGCCCVQ